MGPQRAAAGVPWDRGSRAGGRFFPRNACGRPNLARLRSTSAQRPSKSRYKGVTRDYPITGCSPPSSASREPLRSASVADEGDCRHPSPHVLSSASASPWAGLFFCPPRRSVRSLKRDEAEGATPGFSAQRWAGFFDGTMGSDPVHQDRPHQWARLLDLTRFLAAKPRMIVAPGRALRHCGEHRQAAELSSANEKAAN
jgi:hypothetical protein